MDPPTLPPSTGSRDAGNDDGERVPGVIVVFSGGAPTARAIPFTSGRVELGRSDPGTGKIEDGRISRRHALVELAGGHCVVTDLGSQNGTFIDGSHTRATLPTPAQRVVRIGDTLVVPCPDVRPFKHAGVRNVDGFVRGPAMQALLDDAASAGRSGMTLHVRGQSGTGKEGIAQAFHRASPRAVHRMIAVNCATIPHALAERLLFGARRGAYSGADADAIGYLQEADGGTLFLDEVAELDAQVQAKLLRVLESGELVPLGASKPRIIDFALCSATNKDLRALVAAGTWREDLYFRIGRPAITLPALRNRPEEIPALIVHELARLSPALVAHVSLVEQCLLRPWPGNVRELCLEVRTAARAAVGDGGRVTARHLEASAGSVFGSSHRGAGSAPPYTIASPSEVPGKHMPQVDSVGRQRIEDALRANGGNVAATARMLGLHRTQVRRLIKRHSIAITTGNDNRDGHDDEPAG